MAQNVKVCELDPSVKEELKKFRFRKAKTSTAIVLKIIPDKLLIVKEEEYEDMTPDEIQEELPSHQPRYIVYSYRHEHSDGRVSFPLCFVHIAPAGCKPELSMMYSGSTTFLSSEMGLTKNFHLRDVEDFTEEWLKDKLAFFK